MEKTIRNHQRVLELPQTPRQMTQQFRNAADAQATPRRVFSTILLKELYVTNRGRLHHDGVGQLGSSTTFKTPPEP